MTRISSRSRSFYLSPMPPCFCAATGLSDLLTSSEMIEVMERYDGDPEQVARELVDAANLAGGNDNITGVFVAGSEFLGNAIARDGGGSRAEFHHPGARRRLPARPGARAGLAWARIAHQPRWRS